MNIKKKSEKLNIKFLIRRGKETPNSCRLLDQKKDTYRFLHKEAKKLISDLGLNAIT